MLSSRLLVLLTRSCALDVCFSVRAVQDEIIREIFAIKNRWNTGIQIENRAVNVLVRLKIQVGPKEVQYYFAEGVREPRLLS